MKTFSVALLSLLAVAACKKQGGDAVTTGSAGSGSSVGSAVAPAGSGEASMAAAMAKMDSYRVQMCGCKDKDCATKVNDDFTKWGTEMATTMGKDMKPSEEMAKKMTDTAMAYGECMTKAIDPAGSGAGGSAMSGSAHIMDPKRAAEVVAKIKDMKSKMCACKDKKCADAVNDEFTKWATDQATGAGKDEKPDDATMKTVTDDSMAYGECMTKAMGAGK